MCYCEGSQSLKFPSKLLSSCFCLIHASHEIPASLVFFQQHSLSCSFSKIECSHRRCFFLTHTAQRIWNLWSLNVPNSRAVVCGSFCLCWGLWTWSFWASVYLSDRVFFVMSLCNRQLSTEQAVLQESLQKESKVNKRLSMENEELLWKLHNGDLSSPRRASPPSASSPSHALSLQSPRGSVIFSSPPLSPR